MNNFYEDVLGFMFLYLHQNYVFIIRNSGQMVMSRNCSYGGKWAVKLSS